MAKTIQYPSAEWLEAKVDKTGCSLEEAEMASSSTAWSEKGVIMKIMVPR